MFNDISDWLDGIVQTRCSIYLKRLSGNDTLANGTHQAGPYLNKEFMFGIFPELNHPEENNPDTWFEISIDSHSDNKTVRAVWYNNKLRGGTRNETRITQLGGGNSPLLDPESTGSLAIFAFILSENEELELCRIWVCNDELEEDLIEDKFGVIEPGSWQILEITENGKRIDLINPRKLPSGSSCWLPVDRIPQGWLRQFPSGQEIIDKTIDLRPYKDIAVDKRLLRRRACEFEIFRSVEEAIELPHILTGFIDVDQFIAKAQTILQRRKARSGRSLELHLRAIFLEEGLKEDKQFSHNCESEPGKKPDFIFPSQVAYKNKNYSEDRLRMLAVKTTCKDRWRQILNEADRINVKHLFTLQEGISERQFQEMSHANVQLVVPQPLITKYSEKIRPELLTLDSFLNTVKHLD